GAGVRRGRLPGASAAGCPGSTLDCEPRRHKARPVPGIMGPDFAPSLGVQEKMLPYRSITPKYEVPAASCPAVPVTAAASAGQGSTAMAWVTSGRHRRPGTLGVDELATLTQVGF